MLSSYLKSASREGPEGIQESVAPFHSGQCCWGPSNVHLWYYLQDSSVVAVYIPMVRREGDQLERKWMSASEWVLGSRNGKDMRWVINILALKFRASDKFDLKPVKDMNTSFYGSQVILRPIVLVSQRLCATYQFLVSCWKWNGWYCNDLQGWQQQWISFRVPRAIIVWCNRLYGIFKSRTAFGPRRPQKIDRNKSLKWVILRKQSSVPSVNLGFELRKISWCSRHASKAQADIMA